MKSALVRCLVTIQPVWKATEITLDLTIVSQVTQLEEENPCFLSTQIEGLNRYWLHDFESIQTLIEGDDHIAACEIRHKIAG